MSSSEDRKKAKKERKKERKEKKKHKKEGKEKKRKIEEESVAVAAVASVGGAGAAPPQCASPVPSSPPAPDLSKMSAAEKRALLAAGRGARKAAYAGTELGGPLQAKFNKFLRLDEPLAQQEQQGYDPTSGTHHTPKEGEKLEAALEQQFNKALKYQFGGGVTANKRKGLGSK